MKCSSLRVGSLWWLPQAGVGAVLSLVLSCSSGPGSISGMGGIDGGGEAATSVSGGGAGAGAGAAAGGSSGGGAPSLGGSAGREGGAGPGESAGAAAAGAPQGGQTGGGGVSGVGAGGGPPSTPGVHYVGRVDTSGTTARFAWSGTGAVVRFNGTTVSVDLAGGQEYTVVVDGIVKPKLTATVGKNELAKGLAPGEHTVELYRRTEASEGESEIRGFDFGGGTLLAPPPVTRRLEFIGDSITCGYGNEGADYKCDFSAQTGKSLPQLRCYQRASARSRTQHSCVVREGRLVQLR